MTYPTALELTDWLNPTDNDDFTQSCVDGAVDSIERACGCSFLLTEPEQRTYHAEHSRYRTVAIPGVATWCMDRARHPRQVGLHRSARTGAAMAGPLGGRWRGAVQQLRTE